jgi:hypothetical protein
MRRRRGGSGRLVQAVRGAVGRGLARRPEPPYLSAPLRPLPAASELFLAECAEDPTVEMPAVFGRLRYSCPRGLVRPYVVATGARFS